MNDQPPVMLADELVDVLSSARHAAGALAQRLQLAVACADGPVPVIEAAMADVAGAADALAAADARRHDTVATAQARLADSTRTPTLRELAALTDYPTRVLRAGEELRAALQAVDRGAAALALELSTRRADIIEVVRAGTGSPGIYDAAGRAPLQGARRTRGAG